MPLSSTATPAAPPTWWTSAACRDVDSSIFFPNNYDEETGRPAKRICAGCPVRDLCLEDAMRVEWDAKSRRHGIFGGLLPRERHALWRKRNRAITRKRARPVRIAA